MTTLINIAIIVNIVLVLVFMLTSFLVFTKDLTPKIKADLATLNVTILLIYGTLLLLIFISGLLYGKILYLLAILFVIAPLIIGKLVEYKTLKKYSLIQLTTLLISTFYLFIL